MYGFDVTFVEIVSISTSLTIKLNRFYIIELV